MNESIFKKIWNYSITVGQMIMTAIAMAIVTLIVWLLGRPGEELMRKYGLFLFSDAKISASIMEVRGLTLKGEKL